MTTTATQTYDVFISHVLADREFAADIASRLQLEGLLPFYDASIQSGEELDEAIWDALAECRAFITIVSGESTPDAMGMVELGAAAAWNKPIYVLLSGPPSLQLPKALQGYHVFPRNRVDEVLGQIQRSFEPMTDEDRDALARTYRELNVSVDQLGQLPRSLQELVEKFHAKTKRQLSGDRLLTELLRMRKQAKLPRLGRTTTRHKRANQK